MHVRISISTLYLSDKFDCALNLQSIPENGTPEVTPAATPTHQPQPQAPSSVPTQNTSPPVQPSEGPASLSAEQVSLAARSQSHCSAHMTGGEGGVKL